MSIEQMLIFLVAFVFVFLQMLPRLFKWRQARTKQDQALGDEEFEQLEQEPSFELSSKAPELSWPAATELLYVPAQPLPIVHRAEPQPPLPRRAKPRPATAPRAIVRAPLLPRDRSSLRRAMLLTVILGPPRSLEPADRST